MRGGLRLTPVSLRSRKIISGSARGVTTAEGSDLRDIARRFVEARQSAQALPDYPGPLPR